MTLGSDLDLIGELNAVADALEGFVFGADHLRSLSFRLRAVAAQIAERERAIAEAVRERAAVVADNHMLAWNRKPLTAVAGTACEFVAQDIRALDLAPILLPAEEEK